MKTLFWYLDVSSRLLMLRSLRHVLMKCVLSSFSNFRDEALFTDLVRYLDKAIQLEESNLD